MTVSPDSTSHGGRKRRARALPAVITLAAPCSALVLLLIWFDAYFYFAGGAPERTYQLVGTYSLLLAFVGVMSAVVAWVRARMPAGAIACIALSWLGVLLNTDLEQSWTYYVLSVAATAAVTAVLALVFRARRGVLGEVAMSLAVPALFGLLRIL